MTVTPNLNLPLMASNQSQKHVTHNDALEDLDALVQLVILDRSLSSPPFAPSNGSRYIVGPASTDSWIGKTNNIAMYSGGTWYFYIPTEGWSAWVTNENTLLIFDGTNWIDFGAALGVLQNLTLLGIGTAANAINPFSAKLNKALWTAKTIAEGGDGDLLFTMNKGAEADILSFLLQRNFSGRAEVGLIGDDDFRVKVSSNGSSFLTALRTFRENARTDMRESRRNKLAKWNPSPGSGGIGLEGLTGTVNGTNSAVSCGTASYYDQCPRVRLTSAAGAGSSCGVNGNELICWRGDASLLGGFYFMIRFGIHTDAAQSRLFVGLAAQTTAIGNVQPNSLLNIVGLSIQAGGVAFAMRSNDGAGLSTNNKTINSGTFPFKADDSHVYELMLSCEPNESSIFWRFERLNSGDVDSGVISTDLPVNTQMLTPHLWLSNGTTAAAVSIDLICMNLEVLSP